MGKGYGRRPCLISRERENLQWLLYEKKITFAVYARRKKALDLKEGKNFKKR